MAVIHLKDVQLYSKPNLVRIGIILGIGAILAPNYIPKYGIVVGVILFILGTLSIIKATRIRKTFDATITAVARIKASGRAVVMDKDGKIKETQDF